MEEVTLPVCQVVNGEGHRRGSARCCRSLGYRFLEIPFAFPSIAFWVCKKGPCHRETTNDRSLGQDLPRSYESMAPQHGDDELPWLVGTIMPRPGGGCKEVEIWIRKKKRSQADRRERKGGKGETRWRVV